MSSSNLQSPQCHFLFSDGRRCRQLRASTHPQLCHYHAALEKQSQLTNQLADDLAQLLSNPNLSTRDLATALARLIPAVLRGEIQPRNARTVAYLIQTLLQTLRLAQLDQLHSLVGDGLAHPAAPTTPIAEIPAKSDVTHDNTPPTPTLPPSPPHPASNVGSPPQSEEPRAVARSSRHESWQNPANSQPTPAGAIAHPPTNSHPRAAATAFPLLRNAAAVHAALASARHLFPPRPIESAERPEGSSF